MTKPKHTGPLPKATPPRKRSLLLHLKEKYGEDWNPIERMARLATLADKRAVETEKPADIRAALSAWDRVAKYLVPQLSRREVTGEVEHQHQHQFIPPSVIELRPGLAALDGRGITIEGQATPVDHAATPATTGEQGGPDGQGVDLTPTRPGERLVEPPHPVASLLADTRQGVDTTPPPDTPATGPATGPAVDTPPDKEWAKK